MTTTSILLSVHDDDSVLFAALTCLREKPVVIVVLDSHIQPNRGEINCDAQTRALETEKAHKILGCATVRLHLRDDNATEDQIADRLEKVTDGFSIDTVYAPALQGGNRHHDWVARAALKVFGSKVRQYTTYSSTELYTTGDIEIVPTEEEKKIKEAAMLCYESQLRINYPHFKAVLGQSEWLMR